MKNSPQHVLVSSDDRIKKLPHALFGHPRPECIWRNEVGALGIKFFAIYFKMPVRTGGYSLCELFVGDIELVQEDGSKAGPLFNLSQSGTIAPLDQD